MSKASKRYASAIFEIAKDTDSVKLFGDELSKLVEVIYNPTTLNFFTSPLFSTEQKKNILQSIIDKLALSATVANFIKILAEKRRIWLLKLIEEQYNNLSNKLHKILPIKIKTAFPLDDFKLSTIKEGIERTTGFNVLMTVELDQSLIAGIKIEIDDMVYDSSVKSQLDRIEEILQKG